jgi:hypothetical protein
MKSHRAWAFICAFVLLAPLAACGPQVPEDARLLYYGTVDSSQQITQILPMDELNDSPHQVYIYDEKVNKVVAVRTLDVKHHDLNFFWETEHKYRVYFY